MEKTTKLMLEALGRHEESLNNGQLQPNLLETLDVSEEILEVKPDDRLSQAYMDTVEALQNIEKDDLPAALRKEMERLLDKASELCDA